MDILSLSTQQKADEGVDMPVEDPRTGEEMQDENGPVIVTVCGTDSKIFREYSRRVQNKRLKDVGKKGKVEISFDAKQIEEEALEQMIACTIGWRGIGDADGEIGFSEDNCRRVYTALPWLREQVEVFMSDRANFFMDSQPKSSTTSDGVAS